MTVQFRLLGDVDARVDGQPLEIGHARQRCVLAALLIDVNRPVPLEQLVDRVWSDRPPYSARSSLTSYVSRLRNLFGDAHGVALSREPGGYVLATDPASVDLHRFNAAVSKARATADPHEGAVLFDRALEVWGGEPFASLDTPWFNDVRNALQAELLSVQLDRNDVALRAGRHRDLLVELLAAQAAHPLDERLAGQLMLAQYRCGRQANALETYRQTRQRLVDELGLEPGPALRRVHQQILTGDTDEEAADVGPPASDVESSVQPAASLRGADGSHWALLRRVTSFVGHGNELQRTLTALRTGPLVTLAGVGGVGKTRMALEVARLEQERFSAGVWICELGPLENDEGVADAVAATLRLRRQQGRSLDESIVEYLRPREALLVVDNCEHVLDVAAALVERIIGECPGVSVLVTTRQPLGIEGEQIVMIEPLPVEDATRLFADRARASRPDFRLDQQQAGAVADICKRVDCLPLAVEIAAARMRVMSARDVMRRLDHLYALRGGVRGALPRQQSLNATIDWSYRLLTAAEQTLFVRLSVFAGSFDLEAAHGVCGVEGACEDSTLELLVGLVDKSMVIVRSVTNRTRYGVLETLRAFGRERLREAGCDASHVVRHAVYFTELAERAAVGLQGAEEREWVERMLPDYDNLRTAFDHAMAQPDIDVALRLVTAVSGLVDLRFGYEVAQWAERVIEVADPSHPLYPAAVGAAARGAWNDADYVRAKALAALAEGRTVPPRTARFAHPADVAADAALFEGDARGVLAYWNREAKRARKEGNPTRLVWTAFVLSVCHGVLGRPEVAVPGALEAVAAADATGNPTARSMAYFALAYPLKMSDPDRALTLFEEAARLAGEVQNFWWYGIALMEAAATRAVHGDPATAAQLFVEVLDHWNRVGDLNQQWVNLRYIARLLVRIGDDDEAAFLYGAVLKAGKRPPFRGATLDALIDRLGADRFETYCAAAIANQDIVTRVRPILQRHAHQVATLG
ncbi:transcriptional regulator [Mycobacterium asiaticum]|uniref:Transcriptional regulator n=1 Tax=Mycobacterium asiaticum TaxID=1790 RepID=A0A1A3NSA5_MYCAS|nr:BTAD domain-containing putative transcriptional regulator [Mycobacterium asiaticum]OBK23939.1 transcriptional regulator [Mycobacterium asiaticum]